MERLRNAYGRLLINCLREGFNKYGQGNADNLRAIIQSTQDPFPFFAALETLANEPKVVRILNQYFPYTKSQPWDSGISVSSHAPNKSTNGEISSLTMSTDLRSRSIELTPLSSANSLIKASPTGFRASSDMDSLPSRFSLASDAKSANFQNIVHYARRSITADTLAAGQQQSDPEIKVRQKSSDSIVHMLNHACFLMYELLNWQPVMHPEQTHKLSISPHLQQMHLSNSTALLNRRYPRKHQHKDVLNVSSEKVNMKKSEAPTTHLDQTCDSELRINRPSFSGPETMAKKAERSITRAEVDDLLALASGGKLDPQSSDSETEPDILFNIGGTITSDPETRIDRDVCSVFHEMISGLAANFDCGQHLASRNSQNTHHPSMHYQRLTSDLQHCITEAPPRVNVAMSAERANATRALYKLLEKSVTRPNDLPFQPHISSASAYEPTRMPYIEPPPGFEVRWNLPYAARVMSVAPQDVSNAPSVVSYKAVLPSNAPPLPKLAPKPSQTSSKAGQTNDLPPFPSDQAGETRARLTKRLQSPGQMKMWALTSQT